MQVHLPAGGAMRARRFLEDVGVAIARERHLAFRPREIGVGDAILPAHVVVAMNAGLVTGFAYRAHHVAGAPSDVGARKQGAVEQRAHAVVLDDRSSLHLVHEATPKYALDRAARVIRAERKQERREDAVLAKQLDEIRNAFARPPKRVDVYF